MQFFYIDYMKDGKKERNIGFLRVEDDGISVGLRGVPAQCGSRCRVYVTNIHDETVLLGEVDIKGGYGMRKFGWKKGAGFEECVCVEVPLYGNRKGVCVLREKGRALPAVNAAHRYQEAPAMETVQTQREQSAKEAAEGGRGAEKTPAGSESRVASCQDIYEEIHEDKWQQLLSVYPQVHICPNAQSILIRPKDVVILTGQYHELATNSFVLHAYYNYRQLLLFRYMEDSGSEDCHIRAAGGHAADPAQYYLGVPGVYYEREQRIAQLFGFEGFENGEARMQQDADRKVYRGCFGYYMKRVEI